MVHIHPSSTKLFIYLFDIYIVLLLYSILFNFLSLSFFCSASGGKGRLFIGLELGGGVFFFFSPEFGNFSSLGWNRQGFILFIFIFISFSFFLRFLVYGWHWIGLGGFFFTFYFFPYGFRGFGGGGFFFFPFQRVMYQ